MKSRQRINEAGLPASPPQYDDIIATADIHCPNSKTRNLHMTTAAARETEMNQKPVPRHLKSKAWVSDSSFYI